jgi:hypothetical protein
MISTFTDRRDLLIGGATPKLPGAVVVAEKRLVEAQEFGTRREVGRPKSAQHGARSRADGNRSCAFTADVYGRRTQRTRNCRLS